MEVVKKTKGITYAYILVRVATLFYDYLFREGEGLFKGILLILVVIISRLLFTKTFLRKSQSLYIITLIFSFLSIYLANIWGFYSLPSYDKVLHLISGVILALLGFIIYISFAKDNIDIFIKNIMVVIFPTVFAIASAGMWEIWEFTTDKLFGLYAQNNNLVDTMLDIICGSIGGLFVILFIYLWYKGKKIKVINYIIDEFQNKK